jgi:flagellar biosynthesis protein FlhA
LEDLPGQIGHEPVFGLEGKWVPVELRGQAELLGATVVDRSSVIITHLSETVRRNASRLLGREEVAAATKALKRSHPTVVEDLTPSLLSLAEIQRVLHGLLDEGIPIRDMVRIFEALSLAAKAGTEPDRLVEAARAALAPAIIADHSSDGHLDVLTLEPTLQQALLESLRPGEGGPQLVLQPDLAEALVATGRLRYNEAAANAHRPVLVCAPQLRLPLRRLMRMAAPEMPVLSYSDISSGTARVDTVGVIEDVRNAVL